MIFYVVLFGKAGYGFKVMDSSIIDLVRELDLALKEINKLHHQHVVPKKIKPSLVAITTTSTAFWDWALPHVRQPTCLRHAIKLGCLQLVQHLYNAGYQINQTTCEAAALGGHLDILKWARANGCPWSEETCEEAAWGGHLETLQWARANGCPWDESTCFGAALGGHLEILQWARANGRPWEVRTCEKAARRGHLEILQWARGNGCPWDEDMI